MSELKGEPVSTFLLYGSLKKIRGCYSGSCEYCNTLSSTLKLVKITDSDSLMTSASEQNFYTNPFWCCNYCLKLLTKVNVRYTNCAYMIREEQIDKRLLESGHIRNVLIRKMKRLEEIFPEEIAGIFIIPSSEVYGKYSDSTNILVSFKNLSILNYFRFVIDKENECLMHTWLESNEGKLKNRAKFWRAKDTRILLALSRIHCQSELINIWVWADTRILSIEFFCKTPVNMLQISPKKILRVT